MCSGTEICIVAFQCNNIVQGTVQYTVPVNWCSRRANAKQTEVFFVSRKCSPVQWDAVFADSIRAKTLEINYITVLQGKENGEINFREDFLLRKGENVKGCIALDFAPIGNKFALFSKSKTVMVPTGLSVDLNIFHILQHLRL